MDTRIGRLRLSQIRPLTSERERAAKRLALSLALALAMLSFAGCDSGDVLGDFEFDLSGPYAQVSFAGSLENAEGLATLSGVRVLLNGVSAQTRTLAEPAAATPLTGSLPAARDQQHRLSIIIDAQTASPSLYRISSLSVQHQDSNGRVTRQITLDPRTASLRTGEAIEYAFRF